MKKKLKIIIPVLLIAIVGGLYFMGIIGGGGDDVLEAEVVEYDEHGDPIVVVTEALYLPLNPPFVVNFTHEGTLRYLQAELEVMYHEESLIDRVTANMPAIRNALILLLSDQEFEKLSSRSGKEQLRREMLATVNDVILTEEEAELDIIGEVYITNYIMQ